jgi:hypothetical protein
MYDLALTWLLGLLGFVVVAGAAMAVGLWVRQRFSRRPDGAGRQEADSGE